MSASDTKSIAYSATRGVLMALCDIALVGFVVSVVLFQILNRFSATDQTDAGWQARSGLALRTDHGTGCQYLETRDGHLSPRLGQDGRQVCGH